MAYGYKQVRNGQTKKSALPYDTGNNPTNRLIKTPCQERYEQLEKRLTMHGQTWAYDTEKEASLMKELEKTQNKYQEAQVSFLNEQQKYNEAFIKIQELEKEIKALKAEKQTITQETSELNAENESTAKTTKKTKKA